MISVVMPVYNAAKFLDEAIHSILSQTYSNFELIIINDGSTDDSLDIIKSFKDNRIRLVENEVNLGLIKTLNKGIALAKGNYIARIDSDDVCKPERFELQLECFNENDDIGVVGSIAEIIDGQGKFCGIFKVPEFHQDIKLGLLFGNQIIHPAVMIKRAVLKEFEPDVFDINQLHVEDYALWVQLIKKYTFHNLQTPLVKYRIHGENISVVHAKIQSSASLT